MKGTVLILLALLFLLTPLSLASSPESLTEEQSKFVEKMETFQDAMEARVLDAMSRLNGTHDLERKSFEFDTTDSVVKVARGPVVEKGGFRRTIVKKALPPMMGEPLVSRYFQIDIFPKTPLVGMLHIAMNFSYSKDGTDNVGGIMDITPGTIIEEDLAFVKGEMDKIFKTHGMDVGPYREPLLHGHHKDWLKGSGVGVSFYGRRGNEPPLTINEKNFDLVRDAVQAFFDSYVTILEKRKGQQFTEKDVDAMFDMRRRWLEKQFLWDPFTAKGLSRYEVWSLHSSPPAVRF
jgi:coproporphyrinogen III oxidase